MEQQQTSTEKARGLILTKLACHQPAIYAGPKRLELGSRLWWEHKLLLPVGNVAEASASSPAKMHLLQTIS